MGACRIMSFIPTLHLVAHPSPAPCPHPPHHHTLHSGSLSLAQLTYPPSRTSQGRRRLVLSTNNGKAVPSAGQKPLSQAGCQRARGPPPISGLLRCAALISERVPPADWALPSPPPPRHPVLCALCCVANHSQQDKRPSPLCRCNPFFFSHLNHDGPRPDRGCCSPGPIPQEPTHLSCRPPRRLRRLLPDY